MDATDATDAANVRISVRQAKDKRPVSNTLGLVYIPFEMVGDFSAAIHSPCMLCETLASAMLR